MKLLFLRIIPVMMIILLLCSCTQAGNELKDHSEQRLDVNSGSATGQLDNNSNGNAANKRTADENMPDVGGRPETQADVDNGYSAAGGKPGTQIAASGNGLPAVGAKKGGTYVAKNVYLEGQNVGGLSEKQLAARLQKIADQKNVSARNAVYNQKTWEVTKEQVGRRLDAEKLMKAILSAGPGERFKYEYISIYPEVTKEQFITVGVISEFSTKLIDRSRSRIYNIKRAGNSMNNRIIMPGREFSFNRVTGGRTLSDGYRLATIIKKTPEGVKHVKGPAGGVCQLSTTVYNAALRANLKITERHEHSDEVPYVKDGMDATVMYGGVDLKFMNNRDHPVMIKVIVGKKYVTVRFLENTGL